VFQGQDGTGLLQQPEPKPADPNTPRCAHADRLAKAELAGQQGAPILGKPKPVVSSGHFGGDVSFQSAPATRVASASPLCRGGPDHCAVLCRLNPCRSCLVRRATWLDRFQYIPAAGPLQVEAHLTSPEIRRYGVRRALKWVENTLAVRSYRRRNPQSLALKEMVHARAQNCGRCKGPELAALWNRPAGRMAQNEPLAPLMVRIVARAKGRRAQMNH